MSRRIRLLPCRRHAARVVAVVAGGLGGALLFMALLACFVLPVQSWSGAYIARAYIYPRHPQGMILPPAHYSGSWRMYHWNGQLSFEGSFEDGSCLLNGCQEYDPEGRPVPLY